MSHSGTRIKSSSNLILSWLDCSARKVMFCEYMCTFWLWLSGLAPSYDFWGCEGWYSWRRTDCRLRRKGNTLAHTSPRPYITSDVLLHRQRENTPTQVCVCVCFRDEKTTEQWERKGTQRARFNLNYPYEQRHFMRGCE